MFRIRFHGRGGQGMKTAAQILGSAFFEAGLQVQDAPRYGAERRGAPIFAYVRAAREPIKERGVIARPDLVIVADDSLVALPAAGVMQGVAPGTVMLIRSVEPPERWQERLALPGPVITTTTNSGDAAATTHVGAHCAGAAARLVGIVGRSHLEAAVRSETGRYGASAVASSLRQAFDAFDAMAPHAGAVVEGVPIAARDYAVPHWIEPPTDSVPIAAPDIRAAATSTLVNTGVWRTLRPVIDYAHCNRCSWICSTLCPDSAIEVDAKRTPHIDHAHCKGCLICVAVCPPHAIAAVPEAAARTAEAAP